MLPQLEQHSDLRNGTHACLMTTTGIKATQQTRSQKTLTRHQSWETGARILNIPRCNWASI